MNILFCDAVMMVSNMIVK